MQLTSAQRPPAPVRRALLVLAAVDWLIAAGMTVTDVRRELAVPVLLVALTVTVALQRQELLTLARSVATARRVGADPWAAAERALADRIGARPARLLLREPRLMWSIVLLVRRRYDGCPGLAFGAHRDALPQWSLLAGLAVLELAVTPLLPLPGGVELLLLLVGGWGLVVTAGILAALVVHPHLVTATSLRARIGCWEEIDVARHAVREVAVEWRSGPRGRSLDGTAAVLAPTGVTNLTIRLDTAANAGSAAVTTVRIWVDDPVALQRALAIWP